jgi:hypothetical protein
MAICEWRAIKRLVLETQIKFSEIVICRQCTEACYLRVREIGKIRKFRQAAAQQRRPQQGLATCSDIRAVIDQGMPLLMIA